MKTIYEYEKEVKEFLEELRSMLGARYAMVEVQIWTGLRTTFWLGWGYGSGIEGGGKMFHSLREIKEWYEQKRILFRKF